MERARTELMRSLGFGKDFIFTHDLMFVVCDVAVKYLKPAQLDDALQVTASITAVKGASMRMRQTVQRHGEVLAAGEVGIACVQRTDLKPRRLPADMLERLVPATIQNN
jgi:tol-pal system-associated acyl-CoA thioesterase